VRFYVTTPQGEKGPYEEAEVRGWLREGTMPRDALVRREDEARGAPATSVFPGEAPAPKPAENPWQENVYAPPLAVGDTDNWVDMNQGSFGTGFALGFFCGCIALIASYMDSTNMGSETRRGVRTGFAVGMAIGILSRIMIAASR
jgi:hypothetical protein